VYDSSMNAQMFRLAYLPCLRCGMYSVVPLFSKQSDAFEAGDLICGQRDCEARHYLKVWRTPVGWRTTYVRDTRRYSNDYYDDSPPCEVRFKNVRRFGETASDGNNQYGPITILRRKKRFSEKEIHTIFNYTKGKCQ